MDIKMLTIQIESDFLKMLIQLFRARKLKTDEGKKIAREFLALLPFTDRVDLDKKLKNFTHIYSDFKSIYINSLKIEEEKKVGELLEKMRGYMRENKIDEAINLVK